MGKFIDSDKLIWQVQNNDKYGPITKQVFISLLQNADTSDVALVIHAHKNIVTSKSGIALFLECSNCRKAIDYSDVYCKYCGAKMDEEINDET